MPSYSNNLSMDARDLPALWTGNLVALMPHKRTLCSTLQPEHYAAENVQSMGIQNERGGEEQWYAGVI